MSPFSTPMTRRLIKHDTSDLEEHDTLTHTLETGVDSTTPQEGCKTEKTETAPIPK